jgi:hypothetical protein
MVEPFFDRPSGISLKDRWHDASDVSDITGESEISERLKGVDGPKPRVHALG